MTEARTKFIRVLRYTSLAATFLAPALLALSVAKPVKAVEAGKFMPPSLDGFTLTSDEHADGDGDGKKETHVRHYKNPRGDRLFNMTTKGVRWAWSEQSHAGAESDRNYVIRDSNCDGEYDQKYNLDEEFHVPDCLK